MRSKCNACKVAGKKRAPGARAAAGAARAAAGAALAAGAAGGVAASVCADAGDGAGGGGTPHSAPLAPPAVDGGRSDQHGASAEALAAPKRLRSNDVASPARNPDVEALVVGAYTHGLRLAEAVGAKPPHADSLASQQAQLDGVGGWGRMFFSKQLFSKLSTAEDYLRDGLNGLKGGYVVSPADAHIVGDHAGVLPDFAAVLRRWIPDWRIIAVGTTATDVIANGTRVAANRRARDRLQVGNRKLRMPVVGKIAIADGCWGGGRGPLALASARLHPPAERKQLEEDWADDSKLVFVQLPYRKRTISFGPPQESLTTSDVAALKELRRVFAEDLRIGVLVLEPWCFPGGGAWLTPAVYHAVRRICTELGIALMMDEAGSACRTGRFLAHSWFLDGEDDAALLPDVLVLGKGLCVGVLLVRNDPSPATEVPYKDSVTSGGPVDMVLGKHVLLALERGGFLEEGRQRALHDACAAVAVEAIHGAVQMWGTCTVWYCNKLPAERDPAALWMEAFGHHRLVLPLDVTPESAPAWLL